MEINLDFLKERPLSYSSIKAFGQSPAHYIHYLSQRREKTPALIFGGLVDVLVLTPDLFDEKYVIMPVCDRRTKEGKARYEAFSMDENNKGKDWITEAMHEEAKLVAAALINNPISKEIFSQLKNTQRKVKWNCKETDLPFVCYMDGEADAFIMDLKTTANADPEDFMRSAYNYQYHIQCAAYLEACQRKLFKFPDYYFVAVEKEAPFGVSVLKASEQFIELGMQEFGKLKTSFKHCMDNNLWHQTYEYKASALNGVHQMDLPGYAIKKITE